MRIVTTTLARIPAHPAPAPRRAVEPIEGELLLASESTHESPHPERDRPGAIPLVVVVIRATRPEDVSPPLQPATPGASRHGVHAYAQVRELGVARTLGFNAVA